MCKLTRRLFPYVCLLSYSPKCDQCVWFGSFTLVSASGGVHAEIRRYRFEPPAGDTGLLFRQWRALQSVRMGAGYTTTTRAHCLHRVDLDVRKTLVGFLGAPVLNFEDPVVTYTLHR